MADEQSTEAAAGDGQVDDVSRIVGTIVATISGKDYIVGPFGFIHWSAAQSLLLKEKRARILQTVRDIKDDIPDDEWPMVWREAVSQAGNEMALGPQDAKYLIANPVGLGTCLWVMIEDKYTGDATRPSREAVTAGCFDSLTAEGAELLGVQILACMGIEKEESAGNESGQGGKT